MPTNVLLFFAMVFSVLGLLVFFSFNGPERCKGMFCCQEKEPSKEMVMEAARKMLSEMSVQEKYKILEAAEKEGMEK